ncbi:lysoplasmalogenase TMEM86A-like isoform X2 [Babylonia areolata]|uniref:lysoplasmalogenase TMEM86A-like isoform X2 n=1 Tax=Babylonia areolata TaxID=304850 RepID=UPI003FD28E91
MSHDRQVKMPTSSAFPLGRRDLLLVPYAVLSTVYLLVFKPFLHLPPETLTAALLKAAPIWYLAIYVGRTPKFASNPLALGVRTGLVLSSLGDMCLIWRVSFFLPGMLCFALAQMGYMYGLMSWLRRGNYTSGMYVRETAVTCMVSYLYLFSGMESWVMAGFVLVYSILLFAMTNLALQRHLVEGNHGSLCGAAGAAFFVVSDFLIGVNKWKLSLPLSEGLIMVTYYLAQAAIAFGAVNSARAKRRE